jgi:hypothetical protein
MFLKTVMIYLQTKNFSLLMINRMSHILHCFSLVSFYIFQLLHYCHSSLLYILSSVEILKTKWYSY